MKEKEMLSRMDPELREFYEASQGYDVQNLEQFRKDSAAAEQASIKPDPQLHIWQQEIPGQPGQSPIPAIIYEPAGRGPEPLPCIVYAHAGGFIFGTPRRQEVLCRAYSKEVNCVVISPDYRLAPENKAPAAIEDVYAALLWAASPDNGLNIDTGRIAVGGVSAGGNLAAAAALMARDKGGPEISLVFPLAAELDHRLMTYSAQAITSPKVWSYDYSLFSWSSYLVPGQAVSYYLSPAIAQDLSGLPPFFAYVGGLDPLLDENMIFWQRLAQAGIDVECHVFPGCWHCFEVNVPEADVSKIAIELTVLALKKALWPI